MWWLLCCSARHAERSPLVLQECLEFVYLVPANSSAALYNPYDLKVVNHKGSLTHNYSTMSAKGVTHYYKGEVRLVTKSPHKAGSVH